MQITKDLGTWVASDQKTEIFWWRSRTVTESPRRTLLVLHGMGEHSGRYQHFPQFLHPYFDQLVFMDHRGHGRSQGLRGHVERFDDFAKDVEGGVQWILQESPQTRLHLFGHSMGGLIALRTLLEFPRLPFVTAHICSPLLGVKVPVPWIKKHAAGLLLKLWPDLQLSNELDPRVVSHDAEIVSAYQTDRLVHDRVTPRFFDQLNQAMAATLKEIDAFRVPMQFYVPGEDHIVDSAVTDQYFSRLTLSAKQNKHYPSFFHEVFNEIGKESAFDDLLTWSRQFDGES